MTQARTFRITTASEHIPLVEALLAAQGFTCEAEPFLPSARRLTAEPFPLGSSLAASFGLIYIQDRSSMLPPAMLSAGLPDQGRGAVCLDMCASPGGKTGILALAAGPKGFVLAAEASRERLATLRQNLRRTGAACAATIGVESQHLALAPACFDAILLDPPCSGWGTVDKNPRVMELWTPEKAETLVRLQRTLLARAAELLRPGGRLMFSTCTTNVRENEEQAAWALTSLPLELDPLPQAQGFAPVPLALPGLAGVLRVGGQSLDGQELDAGNGAGQGFFLARFRKVASAGPEAAEQQEFSTPVAGRPLPERELAQAREVGVDFRQLPPGEVRDFGGKVYFLHQKALELCARAGLGAGGQRWQGLFLGQVQGGRFRPDPRARLLLPSTDALPPAARLNVDEPEPILDLLAGRSLELPGQGNLAGLYFRGLPLGFLTRKGRRLLWSEK
jgi:16S rRNA C967 or C1407 C5-methylase (RsmB/RsmF family)